jgi:hypothetical protein
VELRRFSWRRLIDGIGGTTSVDDEPPPLKMRQLLLTWGNLS